jgi:hypothetical protein
MIEEKEELSILWATSLYTNAKGLVLNLTSDRSHRALDVALMVVSEAIPPRAKILLYRLFLSFELHTWHEAKRGAIWICLLFMLN